MAGMGGGTGGRALWVGLVLAGLLWLGGAGTAGAHAELVTRSPAANSIVTTPPQDVTLVFSERVLASLSQIIVDDPTGRRADVGRSTVGGDGLVMQATLLKNPQPGPYTVLWTAVAADDGHITQGTYVFVVGQGGAGIALASGGASAVPAGITALLGLARIVVEWLGVLGTALWVGLPLYLWLVLRPAVRRQRLPAALDAETWSAIDDETVGQAAGLIAAGAGVTLLSTLAALLLQAASLALATGSGAFDALAGQISGSQYGLIWLAREIVLVVVFVGGAVPAHLLAPAPALAGGAGAAPGGVRRAAGGQDIGWSAVVGLVYLSLLTLDGHAAAMVRTLPLSLVTDWLHLVATVLWVGGTVGVAAALMPALRTLPPRARAAGMATLVPAFSPWALGAVGVIILTGTGNAVLRSTDLAAWAASAYGRALLVKTVLFLAMVAVSRYHAFVLRPRLSRLLAEQDDHGPARGREEEHLTGACAALERWTSVNPYLAAGILFCVAVMTSSPPPV